jgi:hypothetical protein
VPITEHHVVMQRAGASIARIDAALAEAQRCGTMSFFNAEYRPAGAKPRAGEVEAL